MIWVVGAIIFGSVLRVAYPSRMAIEHFDEGVYASNIWFGAEQGFEYPARYLYAPPLLPAAIEWTMIVAGMVGAPSDGATPMIPCLLAGIAMIVSLWWVGRNWFGPSAGVACSWLVAGSDLHCSYSRSAMTDVPVCLLILWAVYFFPKALAGGKPRDLALAAAFTALAWWTKYSGWLPLAIASSGCVAWQLFQPRLRRHPGLLCQRFLIAMGLALILWSPVLLGLQKHGGYSAVASNHRQYMHGLTGWTKSASRQLLVTGLYDSLLSAPYEALVGSSSMELTIPAESGEESKKGPVKIPLQSLLLLDQDSLSRLLSPDLNEADRSSFKPKLLENAFIPWLLLEVFPVVLIIFALGGTLTSIVVADSDQAGLSAWLLLAWICGLLLSTPFYHPYPRLILPLLVAVWLGVGAAIQFLGHRSHLAVRSSPVPTWESKWPEIMLVGGLLASTLTRCQLGTFHAWQDRSSLSRAAATISSRIRSETKLDSIVYVMGEPALFFHLKAAGLPLVGPVQGLEFLEGNAPVPVYLVRTSRAFRSRGFQDQWQAHRNDLEIVDRLTVRESHLVVLDENLSIANLNGKMRQGEAVSLFRAK